ncbi:MAG: LPS export ABC transporter periplasmic protein LptC [Candidatus Eisenbacteria bacterium]|nr:LPS export ABC transporter periplasmic protein LptC [Candidatus Eisenbacteria bacterium]
MRCAFTAAVAALLVGCNPTVSNPPRPGQEVPAQEIDDFSFTETRLGVPRWTLHAKTLSDFRAKEYAVVGGVLVDFFQLEEESLVTTSTLRADSGEFRRSTRDMRVWGDVVIHNREGTELYTGWLRWTERTGRITTLDTVLVQRGVSTMRGTGLESDPELRDVRILADVTGNLPGRK